MSTIRKRKLLIGVYNEIDFDGRVQRAAEALSREFDEVIVISVDSGDCYRNRKFKAVPVKLERISAFRIISLIYFWLIFIIKAIRIRPAVVYAHDNFMAISGYIAALLTKSPFVYDAHELAIPENGLFQSGHHRFFYWNERLVVRKAKLVIAANAERSQAMRAHYRLKERPLVIRNIAPDPVSEFTDDEIVGLYPAVNPGNGDIRLVYQGDMSVERGIDHFVRAMRFLPDNYRLILIGGGPDVQKLRELSESQGVQERVVFIGKVPRDHLFDLLRMCNVGIVAYSESGLNNKLCAPNKIYEYAQAGLPIITTKQRPMQEIMRKYHIGILIEYENLKADPEYLYSAVSNVSVSASEVRRFLKENNWSDESRLLRSALCQLIENRMEKRKYSL